MVKNNKMSPFAIKVDNNLISPCKNDKPPGKTDVKNTPHIIYDIFVMDIKSDGSHFEILKLLLYHFFFIRERSFTKMTL